MDFLVTVREVSGEFVKRVEFRGDVEGFLELPLALLGISVNRGDRLLLSLSREKDPNYKNKYSIYMNGIVYYLNDNETRISIGGLILSIDKRLPLAVGDRVYVGLRPP